MHPIQSATGRTVPQPDGFLAFIPDVLPPRPELRFDEASTALQAEASAALGRLRGIGEVIPNRDLFVGMYVRKEAILSSRIEDIECTLDDVLKFEEDEESAGIDTREVAEVVNYVRAVNLGFAELERGTISLDLLKRLHGILAPGSERPGEFRDRQNWIGSRERSSDVRTARYVPPPVAEMHERLLNLAYYIAEHQGPSPLVRAAVAHAQFETIHPFHDGNGRIGRMLALLILRAWRALDHPLLYLSLFLRNNRLEYYDRLMAVRERGDWNSWLDFFMRAVRDAAEDAIRIAGRILELRSQSEAVLAKMPPNTRKVYETLFAHPVADARAVQRHTGLGFEGAQAALRRMEEAGWLRETTGKKRGRTYRFSVYLDALEG
jgi:Fic family protein